MNSHAEKLKDPRIRERIEEIMHIEAPTADSPHLFFSGEAALPGERKYSESGHSKMMLRRYIFAAHFAKGKVVLDSCCGLGWGAYILAAHAKHVVAFDSDKSAISFSRSHWRAKNLDFIRADALRSCFKHISFDIVVGMETIEHFALGEGKTYLEEARRVLKKRGSLILSSSFPETRAEADSICSSNPIHEYIYTEFEIRRLLETLFTHVNILGKSLLVAN